jgi:hypothetical protein
LAKTGLKGCSGFRHPRERKINGDVAWSWSRYFCPCWFGRALFSGEVSRLTFLPILAGKGVFLWGDEQVDISAQHLLSSFSRFYGGKFHL